MRLPDGVLGMAERGPYWAHWVDDLPRLVDGFLDEWELRTDGWMMHGYCALVVPVVTSAGDRAVLKVSFPDEETEHEHLALTHWNGEGAVRLLRAAPRRRAMLLERLRDVSLADAWDIEACTVVGELYGRLHIPAPPQLRTLSSYVGAQLALLRELPRGAPLPRRLVQQALSLATDLVADPATDGTLLHTDLHYENVLSADRAAWLVIDPKPLSGDPHYELAPMLWNRFDELQRAPGGASVRDALRRRFHTLIDVAGLDEGRARDWVVVRMVLNAASHVRASSAVRNLDPDEHWLTICVTIAKAVQD
ncbi:aminoglycoside phosphotransferase family protein [Nocardioides terrisoli]|uniref:aminoglycoside phosphotransferase family protein n=1 Tax=Nocardioides terrisoli TaxID=3388267 RepID=UPI00287B81CA|nr:aminoglycoside phosphotransferase family protein [Nocardioides marmorisolisilvae]